MLLKLNIKKIRRWKRWKKSELQNDRNFYSREKREKSFWADIIKLFISEWCFYRDNEYWQLLNSLLFPIICVCMFLFFRNFLFYFRFWHNCIENSYTSICFDSTQWLIFFSQFTSTLIKLFCNHFFSDIFNDVSHSDNDFWNFETLQFSTLFGLIGIFSYFFSYLCMTNKVFHWKMNMF